MKLKNKLIHLLSITALTALPLIAKAAGGNFDLPPQGGPTSINTYLIMVKILQIIWPMFIGYAIIMFIVAGYKFLANKPEEGRKGLLLGVIGVVIGVLAWSLPVIISGWI